ncbi:hypothetical protein [uncultured Bartonella sp.]|uniref:hypothetical protein n=1 Tax=uncultured Bartonella sp. TaxID=104108 RepID=UPI0025FA6DFF|nr:hypothetical protein [uncultured Bartonella sp.]
MKNLSQSFPTRPLTIRRCDYSYLKRGLICFLLFSIIFPGFCVFWKPHFIEDFQIMNNPEYVQNFTLENNHCNAKLLVFRECRTDAKITIETQEFTKHFSVSFFGLTKNSYPAYIIYQHDNLDKMVLNLEIEHIWQRLFVFFIVSMIAFLIAIKIFSDFIQQYRQWRVVGSQRKMIPTIVALKKLYFGYCFYRIHLPDGKIQKRLLKVKRKDPFVFVDQSRGYVLGAIPEGCNFAIVFDQKLDHVDLTEAEKKELMLTVANLAKAGEKIMRPMFS